MPNRQLENCFIMIKSQLDFYNQNVYVLCLSEVFDGLKQIEEFLLNIEINDDYRNIESIVNNL